MRVTQGIMYNSFVTNMNRTLGDYMESNIQSSSQKRVNRPSDDPVAAGRIMSSRATLGKMKTWESNINTAYGWINLADQVLGSGQGSVQEILNRIKVLAEQGADGTKSAENRLQISFELRESFEQLINLANTTAPGSGDHLFAGHKTQQPAYVEGLGVTVADTSDYSSLTGSPLGSADFKVTGDLTRTMIIQPVQSGDVSTMTAADFRYSTDGGATWKAAESYTNADGMLTIEAQGVMVSFPETDENGDPYHVTGVAPLGDPTAGPENPHSKDNGTWLYIRPTAIYQGDDHDNMVSQNYAPAGSAGFTPGADGAFSRDVAVRLDKEENGELFYSYSTDDGNNWVQVKAPAGSTTLAVPGGYLTLDRAAVMPADAESQFIIHPDRADIYYQIGDDSTVTVNFVGKEIFGGLYDAPRDGVGYPVGVDSKNGGNLFEVIGKLIAAAETNSQQGMQEALPELDAVMKNVLTAAAVAGGRANRLTSTAGMHMIRQFSEEDTLSRLEDADLTELMTRMAQQQVAYQSVLKSSSMIMQMSLINFL